MSLKFNLKKVVKQVVSCKWYLDILTIIPGVLSGLMLRFEFGSSKQRNRILLLATSLILISCAGQKSKIDNRVVASLDLQRYLGTWYEIARFDHSFEHGLVGVQAEYSLRNDGKIKVVNSGYKDSLNGKYTQAVGKAKIPDPINEPAKLKVSFFWIFYGDYYVMELDKDYQWALIGSSSDKYLWILSRSTQIPDELYQEILNKIRKRGYDTSKLIKVKQKV